MTTKKISPWKIAIIPVAMFGFGFAMVPLYDVFCDITGLNGKNFQIGLSESTGAVSAQRATLKFLSDPQSKDTWEFRPERTSLELKAGEMITTYYEISNFRDHPVVIQAVPSVAPGQWAQYLVKIECFCFNEQVIQPHSTLRMPLQVTLSAKAPEEVNHLSLSYRIYEKAETAANTDI